jgi:hypothetical protein
MAKPKMKEGGVIDRDGGDDGTSTTDEDASSKIPIKGPLATVD